MEIRDFDRPQLELLCQPWLSFREAEVTLEWGFRKPEVAYLIEGMTATLRFTSRGRSWVSFSNAGPGSMLIPDQPRS
jgi:hypothetical protein